MRCTVVPVLGFVALAVLSLNSAAALAQDTASAKSPANRWSYSTSVHAYIFPGGDDYLQPTIAVDRGRLHLEARYNYEDLHSGSVWVGYNLSAGRKLSLAVTPMVSAVLGRVDGVAPGYELTADWRKLEVFSEGEWVFNVHDWADSFFYAWSELTLAPIQWLRLGIVGQRTNAFTGERDIQRGALMGLNVKHVALAAHMFNPDANPFYVFSVAVDFE
jgi:hypothetical protein